MACQERQRLLHVLSQNTCSRSLLTVSLNSEFKAEHVHAEDLLWIDLTTLSLKKMLSLSFTAITVAIHEENFALLLSSALSDATAIVRPAPASRMLTSVSERWRTMDTMVD